eukprot:GHVU01012977.1.p1 GENE.GHVU01012977.1~~GHVU01012977.1.p1  ORF type:complete len:149 (-),score=5.54 GHVU01012977.1:1301-1747(-)
MPGRCLVGALANKGPCTYLDGHALMDSINHRVFARSRCVTRCFSLAPPIALATRGTDSMIDSRAPFHAFTPRIHALLQRWRYAILITYLIVFSICLLTDSCAVAVDFGVTSAAAASAVGGKAARAPRGVPAAAAAVGGGDVGAAAVAE